MTLGPLALLSLWLCPFLLGAGILRRIGLGPRGEVLGFAAWSLLAGGLATGFVLFLWCLLEFPMDARWVAPVLLSLGLLAAWRTKKPAPFTPTRSHTRRSRLEEAFFYAVVALVTCTVVIALVRASTRSLLVGDEARIWALKAKLLFDCGGLNEGYGLRTQAYPDSHADYPLLNPLLQLWSFLHARAVVAVENRFPVQVFFLALVPALASALRAVVRPAVAGALLLVAQANGLVLELARSAGADQMVALGMLVALDGFLRARRSGDVRGLRLAALGLAFAVASKNEGTAYALALLVAAGFASRGGTLPMRRALRWLLLPLGVLLASLAVRARFGLENDLVNGQTLTLLVGQAHERFVPLLQLLGGYFFTRTSDHAGVFALFLVLLVLIPARLFRPNLRLATSFLVLLFLGWILIYIATPHDLEWHVTSSARRLVYAAFPACVLWVALVLAHEPWLGRFVRARRPYLAVPSSGS